MSGKRHCKCPRCAEKTGTRTLYIRDVPEDLHRRLLAAAALHGRSIGREALRRLSASMDPEFAPSDATHLIEPQEHP